MPPAAQPLLAVSYKTNRTRSGAREWAETQGIDLKATFSDLQKLLVYAKVVSITRMPALYPCEATN
jgi:hypothetical protein